MTEDLSATDTTTPAVEPKGRLRSTREYLLMRIRRSPLSLSLAALFIVTALVAGTFWARPSATTTATWGAGVPAFLSGHWWTVFSALVIPWNPGQAVIAGLAALIGLGIAERRLGVWRTLFAFVVTGGGGISISALLQWWGSRSGEWWAVGTVADRNLDPLTGIVGAVMTATAFMGSLWRRRIRVIVGVTIITFALYDGNSANMYRLIAMVIGYFLGMVLARNSSALALGPSSHAERRTLVAAIVAATALGPLVAFAAHSSRTPFALTARLFMHNRGSFSWVVHQCGPELAQSSDSCIARLSLISSQGPGMFLLAFLPMVLSFVAAAGLWRGRRFAWWLAVGVQAVTALTAPTVVTFSVQRRGLQTGSWIDRPPVEAGLWVIASVALPMMILVLLIVQRRYFRLPAGRRAIRRFVALTTAAGVFLVVTYIIASHVWIQAHFPQATMWDLLMNGVSRLIPPRFMVSPDLIVVVGRNAPVIAYQFTGVAFWFIVTVGMVQILRSPPTLGGTDPDRVRYLLRQHSGGSFGFMATWLGNATWFSSDERSAIGYRVVNGIAITLSDPIAAPEDRERVILEFVTFCDGNSWTPAFYSVHPDVAAVFTRLGWQTLPVGVETRIATSELELTGHSWQKVRYALNRGVKEGMTTVWGSWSELPLAATVQIAAMSEEWVSGRKLPEMGFTLGGLAELKDPEVRIMLALNSDGRVQAVTSWLPVYDSGEVVSWTLDFMRRVDGSMNGVMEFLIVSTALHMRDTGIRTLSLSGVPLVSEPGADVPSRESTLQRFLDYLARSLEPAYGFTALLRFKSRFNPEYVPLSMAYFDPLALPAIGVALSRAYLPNTSPRQAVALLRSLSK